MNTLPIARTSDVAVQSIDGTLLIYDLKSNKVYCLNETSAIVYEACNAKTTVDELKTKHHLTDEIVLLALDQLKQNNLIESEKGTLPPMNRVSRREAIKKAGLGSMIVLPLISIVVAPPAASAQSGGGPVICGAFNCICVVTNNMATACSVTQGGTAQFDCPGPCGVCVITGMCVVSDVQFVCPGICSAP